MFKPSTIYRICPEGLGENNPLLRAIREGNTRLFSILCQQKSSEATLKKYGRFLVEEAHKAYQPKMASDLLNMALVKQALISNSESILHLSNDSTPALGRS